MKIILLTDIKGKGKKFEVKDVAAGYANFLIKNKQAEPATEHNLAKLDQYFELLEQEVAENYFFAEHVAEEATSKEYLIKRAATPRGTLQHAITKEDILYILPLNVQSYIREFASKAIDIKPIKTFGTYEVQLNLFHSELLSKKDVKAIIKVKVEKND